MQNVIVRPEQLHVPGSVPNFKQNAIAYHAAPVALFTQCIAQLKALETGTPSK